MSVAVLFARRDSVYKRLRGADVWDAERDARRWPGAVVAHPPCRAWGGLRHFAKPEPDEKLLALLAVQQVRACGGVLEHPANSTLWCAAGLPKPGAGADAFGGWTLQVEQHWWGHRARKRTWLYIVGCTEGELPFFQPQLDLTTHVVAPWAGLRKGAPGWRPHIRKAEREQTPPCVRRVAARAGRPLSAA